MTEYPCEFGKHVRSLRCARGLTQEGLAERSGLSADTIRRLEHASFSPSLSTLHKLCLGLSISESTLFEGLELGRSNAPRELFDLIASRSEEEIELMARFIRALIDVFDEEKK